MKITIEGTPEEIAALILNPQNLPGFDFDEAAVSRLINRYRESQNSSSKVFVGESTITPFGKEIKKRLVDMDRKQVWLIEQVKEKTGLYCDSSYMNKIMTGQLNTPNIVQAIREILDIPEGQPPETEAT